MYLVPRRDGEQDAGGVACAGPFRDGNDGAANRHRITKESRVIIAIHSKFIRLIVQRRDFGFVLYGGPEFE